MKFVPSNLRSKSIFSASALVFFLTMHAALFSPAVVYANQCNWDLKLTASSQRPQSDNRFFDADTTIYFQVTIGTKGTACNNVKFQYQIVVRADANGADQAPFPATSLTWPMSTPSFSDNMQISKIKSALGTDTPAKMVFLLKVTETGGTAVTSAPVTLTHFGGTRASPVKPSATAAPAPAPTAAAAPTPASGSSPAAGAASSAAGSGATTTVNSNPANTGNHLFNPIKYQNLADLVISLTKNFVGMIALLSVGFTVVGGGQMVISAGNTEAIEKARKTITWAILGLIIALLAFSIVAIIENLLEVA